MKLAVMKDSSGKFPMGGFHYNVIPMAMQDDLSIWTYEKMGHIIIEVDDETGKRLLKEAGAALRHQVEVAILTDAAEKALLEKK